MGMAFVSSSLNLTYPALMGSIIDSVVTRNATALRSIVFFLLGLAVLQAVFSFGQGFWMSALAVCRRETEALHLEVRVE
jgi:ABC-type multidrug transport system fused ATPase/permease subunit